MTIGQLVKKRRLELNITQGKLSRLLGYDHAQIISNIERDVCSVPRSKLKKLCRVLMIDQSTLYNVLVATKAKQIAKDIGLTA